MAWMVIVMAIAERTDEDGDADDDDAERRKMLERREKSD